MGNGATDPKGGGEPGFGNRDRTGVPGIPDSLYRRMRTNAASSVKDGRYYLQLAGAEARERLLLAAARAVERAGRRADRQRTASSRMRRAAARRRTGRSRDRAAETPHPHPETITIKPPDQWTLMGTEQKNLDVPAKVTGQTVYGIDVRVPGHEMGGREGVPGLWRRRQELRLRRDPARCRACAPPCSSRFPDPALTRGRIFSGGVAVIADTLVSGQDRARSHADRVGRFRPSTRRSTPRTCARRCSPRSISPAECASIRATWTRRSRAPPKIVEATYSTPYLPRARMEPGNATVLVTDDRVDIWIGDQSPQETRFSASKITGIPEQNVYLHLCHLGGGFGRNGNGPQAEQAIMIANAHRGTPIHMLWTREEDFIGTTYRAMGVARLKAGLDADGWPIALEVRTAMQEGGFGPESSFDVASRYHVPNYRYSNHTTKFHVPVGTRRGVGQAAHEFYRESFMNELAHAAGKDPYRYRRELIARTSLPYKDDMITALDMAAEMSGWGTPLPAGHGARDRPRGTGRGNATAWRRSAPWCTPCRSAAKARSGWSASTSRTKPASAWSTRCR